jgi:membrane protease YdiL (CAAX protease family)
MLKNQLGELRCGWALALGVVAITLGQVIGGIAIAFAGLVANPDLLMQIQENPQATQLDSNFTIYAHIVASALSIALIIILFKLLYKRPLSQMGFGLNRCVLKFFTGLLLGVLFITSVFLLLFALGGFSIESVSPERLLGPEILLYFCMFLVAALFEEVIMRGFAMTAAKTTRSKVFIILVPSVLFSLMHIANNGFTTLPFINIILAGILFAFLFVRSGSLWLPFGFHFAWNFFQGNIFGIPVSGLETESVIAISYTDSALLNGGAFGAEGGIIVTAVLAVGTALIIKFMRRSAGAEWGFDTDLPLVRDTRVAEAGGSDINTSS